MSRESSGTRAERRVRAGIKRSGREILVTILVLAVVAGALAALGLTQGPKLRTATINAGAAIERSGQRLVLEVDQRLDPVEAGDVRIEPATPFSVSSERGRVVVEFEDPLAYGTDYRVEFDARGSVTGNASTISHAFSTPDVAVHTLVRSGDGTGPDRIVRNGLTAPNSAEVVFEAPRITEYAVLGDVLAVVTVDDVGTPTLQFATPADGRSAPVATPPATEISDLRSAPGETLVGFVVHAVGAVDTGTGAGRLHVHDIADPSGVSREVTGVGGAPIDVVDWTFVPGTTSVVVQSADLQLVLIDVVHPGEPTPLGTHSELRGFLPGSVDLVVADPSGGSSIDLTTGVVSPLELPASEVEADLYQAQFVLLDDERFLERYERYTTGGEFTSIVYLTDPTGRRELYRPLDAAGRIDRACVSPNGEYLAVEVVPAGARPDGYPTAPGYADTTTWFVRIADGDASRGATGMSVDWCR